MKTHLWIPMAGVLLAGSTAQAQFSAAHSTPKRPSVTSASPAGGFLNADDCGSPHTVAGTGTVLGVPFTTGATGTTGQNEGNCFFFGTTAIDSDVWFDWTASVTGTATIRTCGATGVDTKIAVWPDNGPSSCPADGTSIGCNDDACGLQTQVVWDVTAGTTYTLQVGTFPGATGGSGTFDIVETVPPPCGVLDDGVTENALGLTAGGETAWVNGFDCLTTFDAVQTAYGSAMFPDPSLNGNSSRVALYSDSDALLDNGAVLLDQVDTVVVNAGTDILNLVPLSQTWTIDPTLPSNTRTWILASADQVSGQFPAPMDSTNPTPEAWIVGDTAGPGSIDLVDLTNNSVPPLQLQAIGFPAAWVLRAVDTTTGVETGTALCFGDGSGAPCGCANEDPNAGTGGCLNSLGVGARLAASGLPDTTNDGLVLTASDITPKPALFLQGDSVMSGGAGTTFGDGVRCCGGNVVRLEIVYGPAPGPSTVSTSVTISQHPNQGALPGTSRCYQVWYRDPTGSPCGSTSNFSNAVQVIWV